jgi:hypothetical protein
MSKEKIKQEAYKKQNGRCKLSKKEMSPQTELTDTHRKKPKREGGEYVGANYDVVLPVAHMEEHGTLRVLTGEMNRLKQLIDEREHAIRTHLKLNNQLLAYKRHTDDLDKRTVEFLSAQVEVAESHRKLVDKDLTNLIKEIIKVNPVAASMTGVRAIGPITIAYCLAWIDFEKARHASSLWKFTGLHAPKHERYKKGVAGGGNKRLRTVLYTMADSQIKLSGPYRKVYDNVKHRLEHSDKIVISRNTQGKEVEVPWKETKPSHRHGAALRAVMKHFLADLWYVGRTLSGLPTTPLYPEAMLGGTHRTIMPDERGWKY